MNWKSILAIVAVALLPVSGLSQANILNAKKPEEIGIRTEAQKAIDNDAPLDYGYVDDRDILWSKTVWETVDLDERVNFSLYYPIDTIDIGSDRRSLYDVLLKNIKNGGLKDIYVDSYFTDLRKFEDLEATLQKVDTTDLGYEQLNAGEEISPEYINRRSLTAFWELPLWPRMLTSSMMNPWHLRMHWYPSSGCGTRVPVRYCTTLKCLIPIIRPCLFPLTCC